MDLPGILDTLRLAGVVVLAIPPISFGVGRALEGDPVGLAFVGLGLLMVGFERYLFDPLDPLDVAESAIDRVRRGE